ncbi:MAG: hypothetical protein Ct9H300mP1_22130 [Planctomycetaceae bacterium]|nr:MAG: hypothetical protein Ct9H300mP1_22130 [Planctomycetaceae bacterium]
MPLKLGIAVIAVLVASFAATTLDTATRLQRYVLQELAGTFRITPLTNKYAATGLAVGWVAGRDDPLGKPRPGFRRSHSLALLGHQSTVGRPGFYGHRLLPVASQQPVIFVVVPMIVMLIMPAWAMLWNMFHSGGWWDKSDHLLMSFGVATLVVQAWMIVEGLLLWPRVRGIREEALPSLEAVQPAPVATRNP